MHTAEVISGINKSGHEAKTLFSKSNHSIIKKIVRRRWIKELLLTVVNNGQNSSNRCAINETGYASDNSQKSSMQVAMVETTTYKSVVIEAITRNDRSITSCSLGTTSPAMLHR